MQLVAGKASGQALRRRILAGACFLFVAMLIYAALLTIVLTIAAATGESGVSCRGSDCGTIASFLNDAAPLPMIGAIMFACVVSGALTSRAIKRMARRSSNQH